MSSHKLLQTAVCITLMGGLLVACGGSASATSAPAGQTESGNISVSGAFALYPLMVQWADEYQKLHPEVRIDVSAGGAGKGMSDALSGTVDIGMISREIKAEETAKGAFPVGVTRDAVFAIVSEKNPALSDLLKTGVSKGTFAGMYLTGKVTTWGAAAGNSDASAIHVYTRSDSSGAAEMWSKFLGGQAQEDLKGIGVNGDPGITEAVVKDPLGIGYNNLNYAFDPKTGKAVAGIVVVPIDVNGNGKVDPEELLDTRDKAVQAVATGQYPAPPARVLYLVTKGAPNGLVRDFIRWILADGQKYVSEAGYIQLSAQELAAETAKLP